MRRMCGLQEMLLIVSLANLFMPVRHPIPAIPFLPHSSKLLTFLKMTDKQAAAVAKNLDLMLKGREPVAYKSDGSRKFPLVVFMQNHTYKNQQ